MSNKFIDNNSDNLIIVFQSAGRVPLEVIKSYLQNETTEKEIAEYHKKYNFYNFQKYIGQADYYYIEDHYSGIYGWYVSDFGKSVIEKIQEEIKKVATKKHYKIVMTFGSSKGGSGAIIHGLVSPYVNKVVALVPQINMTSYLDKHMPFLESLIFRDETNEINRVTMSNLSNFINFMDIKTKKTVFLYTGVLDEQFNDLMAFLNNLTNKLVSTTLIVNTEKKKHSPIVTDNIEFIRELINNIISNKRTTNKNLIKFKKRTYLYLGK